MVAATAAASAGDRLLWLPCQQERTNVPAVPAVPAVPQVFFSLLSSWLAYSGFNRAIENSVNSKTIGNTNRFNNTTGIVSRMNNNTA